MHSLPTLPGSTWRPIRPADASALAQFEIDCARLDGATNVRTEADWLERLDDPAHAAEHSLLAAVGGGQIAAAGWIDYWPSPETARAFLDGRVHPDFRGRGIGTVLLNWLESRGCSHLIATELERPHVLRIMFYDRGPDAIALFEQQGFEWLFVEETMRFDLSRPLPDFHLPPGLCGEPWTPENSADFYRAYADAFSTRTSQVMPAAAWHHYWGNPDDPEFKPALSLLIRDGAEPVAFATVDVEPLAGGRFNEIAQIGQVGVRVGWRGQGIGAALLVETMRGIKAAGHRVAQLMVNIDNLQAHGLYDRVGFRRASALTMYRKEIKQAGAEQGTLL